MGLEKLPMQFFSFLLGLLVLNIYMAASAGVAISGSMFMNCFLASLVWAVLLGLLSTVIRVGAINAVLSSCVTYFLAILLAHSSVNAMFLLIFIVIGVLAYAIPEGRLI